MKTFRRYGKGWNSPENRRKLSEAARRAVNIRWQREFADREPEPEPPSHYHTITVKNEITGKVTVITTHPGGRKNNMRFDVDGKHWKTCGVVKASKKIVDSLFSSAG